MTRKKVLSIVFSANMLELRRMVLEQAGYAVTSVQGTQEAYALKPPLDFDAVIVGHAVPRQEIEAMLAWVKVNMPRARIIALQSANSERLQLADFCADPYEPEQWVNTVSQAVA